MFSFIKLKCTQTLKLPKKGTCQEHDSGIPEHGKGQAKDGRMRKRGCRRKFKTRRTMTGKTQKKRTRRSELEGTGTQQVSPVKMEAELGSWEHLARHLLSSETRTHWSVWWIRG